MGEGRFRDESTSVEPARSGVSDARPDSSPGPVRKRPPLVSSTFNTLAAQIASSALALGSVLIIARSLGPTGRGEVVFLITISLTLSALGALGVQEANINFASAQPHLRPALATNSILLAALAGTAVAAMSAAAAIVVPIFGGQTNPMLIGFALASVPLQLLKTYLWRFIQADWRFGIASVSWTLPFITGFFANAALALAGLLSVATAYGTWVGAQLVPIVFLAWHVVRRGEGFGRPSFSLARRTVTFGLQTHFYKIMSMGNARLDQWILGVLGSTRELGLYSVAVALSTSLYQLPAALDLAQRPDLARVSKEVAAHRASVVFRIAAAITGAGALLIAILAPYICQLFGPEFRGSVDDLRVLMLGTIGVVALKLLGNALTAQGRPLRVSVGVAAGFVITVVLDVLLIPRFGGLGAAIASAAAYSTVGIIVAVMFVRTLGGHAEDLIPRPLDAVLLKAQFRRLLSTRRAARPASPVETAADRFS